MNRELAYRCQMLPAKLRKRRTLAYVHLQRHGWSNEVLKRDIDAALAWANTHCLTQQQEKLRRARAARKTRIKGDDALDMMFANAGIDPTAIPRRNSPRGYGMSAGHIAALSKEERPMALGLSAGGAGGEIQPYINYDAKAGRMFRVDRSQQTDGTWATDKVEITNTVQMVMDLTNIRVGWINYTTQGPIRKLVVLGKEPIPPRPDDKNADGKPAFKQGFEVQLLLDKASGGGGARVFGSAAGCVIEAMDVLHDAFTNAAEAKAGKLPVVKVTSVQPVKSGQSTNYRPTFSIVSWIDRPAALPDGDAVAGAPTVPAAAPGTGSTVVAPPVAKAPQPAATADAGDFG